MSPTIRPLREDDRERFVAFTAQAFNVPLSGRDRMFTIPADEVLVAEQDGTLVAGVRRHSIAHFLGGRAVPCAGVAAVAVAAEARGSRVAEAIVIEALRRSRADGVALSSLYPATVPLYRRCGYEYAFVRTRYRAPAPALPRGSRVPVVPFDDEDVPEVQDCYRRFAADATGLVDRPDVWWRERTLAPPSNADVYRFLVREEGVVTGYVVYTQEPPRSGGAFGYDLACRDLVWTTPAAAEALLSFLGRHRSLAREVTWLGAPADPLAFLLAEQDARVDEAFAAMARIVHLPAAIAARGYAPSRSAAVTVTVDDPAIAENAGTWTIAVSGGEGHAEPGDAGREEARCEVTTLASLYTRHLRASDARRVGRLTASDAAVAALEEIFAGPPPWLVDFF